MSRWLLLALIALPIPVAARTLLVGSDQPFQRPSTAAVAAEDGDTVLIEPGEYYDCAVWKQNHLVIAGARPGVVITDTTCQGKALFVITGHDTVIRDLTLARARVPDGNGAGIRQEGQGLVLERVRFVNNEAGLIDGVAGTGAIRMSDCAFQAGGAGGNHPTFAVLVGAIGLLRIERSTFEGVKGGQIQSSAARTELTGNQIGTGTGEAPAVAVMNANGHLVMVDNLLTAGPSLPRLAAAVLVTASAPPELRGNRLLNQAGRPMAMLLNWSSSDPVLAGNQVQPGDLALSTSGLWRHRASVVYYGSKDEIHALAGRVKRELVGLLGR